MIISRIGSTHILVEPAPKAPNVSGLDRCPKYVGIMPSPRTKKPSPRFAGNAGQPFISRAKCHWVLNHRSGVNLGRECHHGRGQHTRFAALPPAPECLGKSVYIVQRRDKAGSRHLVIERGIHDVLRCGDEGVGIEQPGAAIRTTGDNAAGGKIRTHAEARVRHAEWSEDVAPHDIAKAKAAPVQSPDALRHNRVRHDLRITRLFSGHRNRRCGAHGSDDRLKIALLVCGHSWKAGRHPRSVAKKLTERGARLPFDAKLGNHLADRRIESRLAALNALQERNCGQGLRDRKHREDAVMAEQRLVGTIGVSDGSIRALYAFVIDCLERQEVGLWTSKVSRCGFRRRAG